MGWKERLAGVKRELTEAQASIAAAPAKQRLDAVCKAVTVVLNVLIRIIDALPSEK